MSMFREPLRQYSRLEPETAPVRFTTRGCGFSGSLRLLLRFHRLRSWRFNNGSSRRLWLRRRSRGRSGRRSRRWLL
jgi:hypothetical protein